jgi:hypothetical protein
MMGLLRALLERGTLQLVTAALLVAILDRKGLKRDNDDTSTGQEARIKYQQEIQRQGEQI